jgi:hypothetical protein
LERVEKALDVTMLVLVQGRLDFPVLHMKVLQPQMFRGVFGKAPEKDFWMIAFLEAKGPNGAWIDPRQTKNFRIKRVDAPRSSFSKHSIAKTKVRSASPVNLDGLNLYATLQSTLQSTSGSYSSVSQESWQFGGIK